MKTPAQAEWDPSAYIRLEYEMDLLIHDLSRIKPVVAVADGIVMGGGAGIFMGAGM
jgi:enoyl-CoA hydratase/carnithine racemase